MSRRRQFLRAITKTVVLVLFFGAASRALPASAQAQGDARATPLVQPTTQEEELAAFLAAPIDLAAFKRQKGSSNSGSWRASRWFYRPKAPGFFYQYLLFPTPQRYSESERFTGFSIVVYKFGKRVGDYHDTNETLVVIWCRLRDPDLGRANLVGAPVPEIKSRFGEPSEIGRASGRES